MWTASAYLKALKSKGAVLKVRDASDNCKHNIRVRQPHCLAKLRQSITQSYLVSSWAGDSFGQSRPKGLSSRSS